MLDFFKFETFLSLILIVISLHVHDISHLGKLSKCNEKNSQEATAFGNHRDGMNSFLETILLNATIRKQS